MNSECMLDALRYAYEDTKMIQELWLKINPHLFERRKTMNNFKWEVTSIDLQTDGFGNYEISAKISALKEPGVQFKPSDLAKDIESKLNDSDDKMYTLCMPRNMGRTEYGSMYNMYRNMANNLYGSNPYVRPAIKDVIFNDPATIVFWTDGTKTVVKCQEGDIFDPEKGLTMAITKKVFGNKGNYYNEIKKWTEKYQDVASYYPDMVLPTSIKLNSEDLRKAFAKCIDKLTNHGAGDV